MELRTGDWERAAGDGLFDCSTVVLQKMLLSWNMNRKSRILILQSQLQPHETAPKPAPRTSRSGMEGDGVDDGVAGRERESERGTNKGSRKSNGFSPEEMATTAIGVFPDSFPFWFQLKRIPSSSQAR